MRILFDGVNPNSSSGPNSFGKKLWKQLNVAGHSCTSVTPYDPDVQLTFIQTHLGKKLAPLVHRLDGVWFNTAQNWIAANQPIAATYRMADAVVVQSEFDRELVRRYLGPHVNTHVIHNGTNIDKIAAVQPLEDVIIDRYDTVWCCAASWRPHKRLRDNIDYFLRHAPSNACFVVAGNNPDHVIDHPRVLYTGELNRGTLIRLYKRASVFVHLAYLDHCPNVVVDARAAGCHIVCASSGGTREIAGESATVVNDATWDFKPCKLYEPPPLDLNDTYENDIDFFQSIDIKDVAARYIDVFEDLTK